MALSVFSAAKPRWRPALLLLLALVTLAVPSLLGARRSVVSVLAFRETQWEAGKETGPPLRRSLTQHARVSSRFDGGLARPGGVTVEVYYDWGWTLFEEITTTDGEHLGWSGGPCFNLSGDPEVFEHLVCDFGMAFPDGDITVNGAISLDEWSEGETVMAVTGGTGAFRHISGEVAIIPEADFSYSTLVFNVKNAGARY